MASTFHVSLSDLKGERQQITGLRPSDLLATLFTQIHHKMYQSLPPTMDLKLVHGSYILSQADHHENLSSLGFVEGTELTVICMHSSVYELRDANINSYWTRACFHSSGTCVLVESGNARSFTGDPVKTWDVCCGSYCDDGETKICTWEHRFHLSRTGNILVKDSGWLQLKKHGPQRWTHIGSRWHEVPSDTLPSDAPGVSQLLGIGIDGLRQGENVLELLCKSLGPPFWRS
eukprot:gnl/MRDRNA2_/MRDRNA2_26730_c0_seq1.p1 gnl/MRDRNA2_/MRDRNA2_26730_c0~~gnl/MRDRNA2_/MRDRNA2_26730_c0_seq1.p1  ORF type:complete len:263 (-),score=23.94 gnl/MRDRNA2_/MRDRNA2_26730_c0_seq1:111-806(-)